MYTRTKIVKTKRGYSQETLAEALLAAENGMSVSAASKQFVIPRQTLQDKLSGKYTVDCRMGRPSILTPDEEKVLVDWIVSVGSAGFPVAKDQIISSVEKLMENLNRENPFSESTPGDKWFSLFLKRHRDIAARVTQPLTTSRANVTEEQIRKWFDEIKSYVERAELQEIFLNPERVFNCDESAFFLCPKGNKVFVKRGEKRVYSITGNDEKECLTTLVTANAAGDLPPPMVVFAYERVPANVVMKFPESWGIGKSETGWMTGETFYEYITNIFHPWLLTKGIQRPVVLFVDGHVSHLTLHLSEFCSSNQIELISLYPNSTHILQPMDVAVFHPIKVNWRKSVQIWRCENGAAKIKKEDFAPMLKTVFDQSIKVETVQNGFKCTGLMSLNPEDVTFFKGPKNRKGQEKTYSHSQWLLLRGHVQYLESKIGFTTLSQFRQNLFEPEEIALYEVWRAAVDELVVYRGALDAQQEKRSQPNHLQDFGDHEQHELNKHDCDKPIVLATNSATRDEPIILPVDRFLFWNPVLENLDSLKEHSNIELDLPVISVLQESDSSENLVLNDSLNGDANIEPDPNVTSFLHQTNSSEHLDSTNLLKADSNTKLDLPVTSSVLEDTNSSELLDSTNLLKAGSNTELDLPVTSSVLQDANSSENLDLLKGNTTTKATPQVTSVIKKTYSSTSVPSVPTHCPGLSTFCMITPEKTAPEQNVSPTLSPLELREKVSSPFRRALFWPGESQTKKKKRTAKIRLPSAITSQEWKKYYREQEEKKLKEQKEKENRKQQREENAKKKRESVIGRDLKRKAAATLSDKNKKHRREEIVVQNEEISGVDIDLGVSKLPDENSAPIRCDSLKVGNWAMVPYKMGKFNETCIGKIVKLDSETKCATMQFLKKKPRSHKYVWPKMESTDLVPVGKITKVLKEPTYDRWNNVTFGDER